MYMSPIFTAITSHALGTDNPFSTFLLVSRHERSLIDTIRCSGNLQDCTLNAKRFSQLVKRQHWIRIGVVDFLPFSGSYWIIFGPHHIVFR